MSARLLILLISIVTAALLGVCPTTGADRPEGDSPADTAQQRTTISECLIDVREVLDWGATANQSAAIELCKLRRQHAAQHKRFTTALVKLHNLYRDRTNHGFAQHLPQAERDAKSIVTSCIDFKSGFTYPHNLGTLTVPEAIHASCYELGAKVVETELSR